MNPDSKCKPWFVYLLLCGDDSVYTGITIDVQKRMKVHASGKGSKYVARKRFKKLMYSIQAQDKVQAAKLEYAIKQLPRNNKIEFFRNHPKLHYCLTHTQPQ